MRIHNVISKIGAINQVTNTVTKKPAEPQKYLRPVILPEQFKATLNRYRFYIDQYNKTIEEYNSPFRHRNKSIQRTTDKVCNHVALIYKRTVGMDINEYNIEALKFNNTYGHYIKYKYKQTVKPVSIQFFEAILHMYGTQLTDRNSRRKKPNLNYKTTLPKVAVNSHYITTQMRAGVLNLDVSVRTVRNHLDRLEEAGVLLDREYNGTKRPLTFTINPEILVVIDDETRKSLLPKNQPFTTSKRKELQHIKDSTIDLNNNKKKESVNNSLDNGFASLTLKDLFYKSTKPQVGQKQDEKQKIAQKSSAKILKILDRTPVLADKLANGEYNHYVPIKSADMRRLLSDTSITDEDYREICIQDFVKSSAQLWKNKQGSVGSWYEALRHIYNSYGTTNFAGKALTRNAMYNWLMQMRYRLNYAINWFNKRDWEGVWFPNIYFDPLRKLPTDVCFEYTKKVWSAKQKAIQDRATKRRKDAMAAKRREQDLSKHRAGMRKLDGWIYRFLRQEISLEDLTMALTTMPESVQNKFSDRINYLTNKRLQDNE